MKHPILSRLCCLLLLLLPGISLPAQTLPPGLWADTLHAPFLWGVGSFDPTPGSVLLWTRREPLAISSDVVYWELFADDALTQPVASGQSLAQDTGDWTVRVAVNGLQPGQYYWYRFHDGNGNYSVTGRTRTAPSGPDAQSRLAVMSCSSIYSGYFNAYRRIGERNDLDLVVHVGDYIYDFVDANEQVRVPSPAPIDPQTLPEWRERHAYYLLDPDLRLARQMHPWAVVWDNHDVDGNSPANTAAAMQAFQEYVPMRLLDTLQSQRIYRRLQYGDLLDIFMVDVTTLRDTDTLPNGEASLLGDAQWAWLSAELLNSPARWRVIAQERMVGRFSTAGLSSLINYGDGPVADSSAWDGYDGERQRLLGFLDQNGIDNTIFLSGDIHTSFLCDLPLDYGTYNSSTGAGSAAMEFLPTSISRGNFDEAGITGFLAQLVAAAITAANPHHVWSELTSHGYGILDIRPDTATAEFWYSPILAPASTETFARGHYALHGENHWNRQPVNDPTTHRPRPAPPAEMPFSASVSPVPASATTVLHLLAMENCRVHLEHVELATGRVLKAFDLDLLAAYPYDYLLELPLTAGASMLRLTCKDQVQLLPLIRQ